MTALDPPAPVPCSSLAGLLSGADAGARAPALCCPRSDQVNLKVEFEIEDDGTELEIELTW